MGRKQLHVGLQPLRAEGARRVTHCCYCSVTKLCPTLLRPHGLLAACKAPLSFTIFWCLLKLMSIESVMLSNHLILGHPTPPALSLSQHQDLFLFASGGQIIGTSASASVLLMNILLISFRINWFDLFAVQRTLKSLFQHHSSKVSGQAI